MIIVMKSRATEKQIENVIAWIESVGYKAHPSSGSEAPPSRWTAN